MEPLPILLSPKNVILEKLESLQKIASKNVYFGTFGPEPPEGAFFQPVARFHFLVSGRRKVALPSKGGTIETILEAGDVQISLPNSWERPTFDDEHEVICLVPRKTHVRVVSHAYRRENGIIRVSTVHHHTAGPACETLRDICLAICACSASSHQQGLHHLLGALKSFAWQECEQTSEEVSRGRSEILFNQIRGWVETHFQDPISREIVADQFKVNPSHVSRLYQKMTGRSFTENLLQERIDFAVTLLSKTNLAIYQIATQCGFSNTAYFVKCFRKLCGETPGRLRRKLRI